MDQKKRLVSEVKRLKETVAELERLIEAWVGAK